MKATSNPITLTIIGIVLGALVTAAHSLGYQDAKADEAFYCKMVEEGTWKPYKGDWFCNQ